MKTLFRSFLMLSFITWSTLAIAQTPTKAEKKAQKEIAKAEKAAAKAASKAAKTAGAKSAAVTTPATSVPVPAAFPVASETPPNEISVDSIPATTIAFEHDTYDFGKIKHGDVVKHEFVFTNTGKNPLVLENVKPSCGCTAIDWPKEPVAPGKTGKINAQFNSTGKSGAQLKYITVVYNGDPKITRITFSGEVLPAETGSPAPAPGSH